MFQSLTISATTSKKVEHMLHCDKQQLLPSSNDNQKERRALVCSFSRQQPQGTTFNRPHSPRCPCVPSQTCGCPHSWMSRLARRSRRGVQDSPGGAQMGGGSRPGMRRHAGTRRQRVQPVGVGFVGFGGRRFASTWRTCDILQWSNIVMRWSGAERLLVMNTKLHEGTTWLHTGWGFQLHQLAGVRFRALARTCCTSDIPG